MALLLAVVYRSMMVHPYQYRYRPLFWKGQFKYLVTSYEKHFDRMAAYWG